MEKLFAAARLRSKTVEIEGVTLICREPPAAESLEYQNRFAKSPSEGMAYLLERNCLKPDGSPAFTREQALEIANGSARVMMPLFTAITGSHEEKKASPTPSDSDTDSPQSYPDRSPN